MLNQSYLTLQSHRLKPLEKWTCEGDDLYLLFPDSGFSQLASFSKNLPVAPGDMVVLSGRSGARLMVPGDGKQGELVFRWFANSFDSLFPLFSPGEICMLQNVVQEFRNPKVYAKANPLVGDCRRILDEVGIKLDLIHRSKLLSVAATLLSAEIRLWQRKPATASDGTDDHMLRVFEQLSSHELLNCSVEELADKFGCSRRHLSRLFHQRFGLSVATLRMEMRLLKASSLLRDPNVKVINVAEQCGFNHLGLFNTCFKRRFGLTPGVWRNSLHERAGEKESKDGNETCPLQVSGICPMAGKGQKKAFEVSSTSISTKSSAKMSQGEKSPGTISGVSAALKANHTPKLNPAILSGTYVDDIQPVK